MIKIFLLLIVAILTYQALPQPQTMNKLNRRSIHHPIQHAQLQGDDQSIYYYYVDIMVGTPPVQQSVIVDTGSHMTGFTCQPTCKKCGKHLFPRYNITSSETSNILDCQSQENQFVKKNYCKTCESKSNHCQYKVSYMEGSSYSGIFLKDKLQIGNQFKQQDAIDFIFGCHQRQTNLFYTQLVNGIMGLGYQLDNKYTTLPSALYEAGKIDHNEFSLCLGHTGGFLQIGDYNNTLHLNQSTEPDYFQNIKGPLFTVNVHQMSVWNKTISLEKEKMLASFDSGTTIVQMPHKYYDKISSAFKYYCGLSKSFCSGKLQNMGKICYKKPIEITYKQFYASFPPIYFTLDKNISISWLPSEYFYSSMGGQCVGMASTGQSRILLGGTFMRQKNMIFDIQNNLIGIKEALCSDHKDRIFVDPKVRSLQIGETYDHIYLDNDHAEIKFPHNLNFTYTQNVIENKNVQQQNGPSLQVINEKDNNTSNLKKYSTFLIVCVCIMLILCCWKNVVVCCCRHKFQKLEENAKKREKVPSQEDKEEDQQKSDEIVEIEQEDTVIGNNDKHLQNFVQSASEIQMQYQMRKGKYGALKEQI